MLESNFVYGPPEVWERYTLYPATTDALAVQLSATEAEEGGGFDVAPVPEREIAAGEFEASLVTVTLPELSPAAAGAKVTFRVAFCPGVKIWPDETPLAVYPAPEMVTFEIVTLEFPPLVKTTGRVLLLPTLTVEKLRLVLLALRVSVAGGVGVLCWLDAVLGALVTPVQPAMDRIAKSRRTRPATGIACLPVERTSAADFRAPLNSSFVLRIFIASYCELRNAMRLLSQWTYKVQGKEPAPSTRCLEGSRGPRDYTARPAKSDSARSRPTLRDGR